jgi:hypothetical protein
MISRRDQDVIMSREPGHTLRSMAGCRLRCQKVEPEHLPLDAIVQSLVEVGIFLPHHHVASTRDHHARRL